MPGNSQRPQGQLMAPALRPKKTHDSSKLGAIQKMSIAMKRVKNKKITANNEKGLRFEAHKANPSPSNSPPPPPSKSPSQMGALLAKLSPNSIKDLFLSRKRRQGELTHQPGNSHHLNEFHPVLAKAVDEGNAYLLLHLFTSTNLTLIASLGFSLPDKKVYLPNGTSVRILDVDNSVFGKEAEMTEVQWRDALYLSFRSDLTTHPDSISLHSIADTSHVYTRT